MDDVAAAKQARQQIDVTDQAAMTAAVAAMDCTAPDPLRGIDDPTLPLVTCDREDTAVYLLDPVFLTGDEVLNAETQPDPNGIGYVVMVEFTTVGQRIWSDFTTENVGIQVAFVLDTEVISAPQIEGAILGPTTITGGQGGFTEQEAEQLAVRIHEQE